MKTKIGYLTLSWLVAFVCSASCQGFGYPRGAHWQNPDQPRRINDIHHQTDLLGKLIRASSSLRQPTSVHVYNPYATIVNRQAEYGSVKGHHSQAWNGQAEVARAPEQQVNLVASPMTIVQGPIIRVDPVNEQPTVVIGAPTSQPEVVFKEPGSPPATSAAEFVNQPPVVELTTPTIPTPLTTESPTTQAPSSVVIKNDLVEPDETKESNPVSPDSAELASKPAPIVDPTPTTSPIQAATLVVTPTQTPAVLSSPPTRTVKPVVEPKESNLSSTKPVEEEKKPQVLGEPANVPAQIPPEANSITDPSTPTANSASPRNESGQPDELTQDTNSDSGGSNMTTYSERMEIEDKP